MPDPLEIKNLDIKNLDIKNLTVEDVVVIYAYAEAIVETVREPLIILDGKLRIKTANKSFFEQFKVNKEDTYEKLIFDIGNGQWNIPSLKKLLKDILPQDSHFNDYEVTHTFEDIGERVMLLNARRIVLEGNETELILLAIEDITDKKILDKQKDDFIGVASHELKTPLTSIKAYLQILQHHHEHKGDEKSLFLLDKASQQVERMEEMMASFVNAYRLQTGKLDLNKQQMSLDELVNETIDVFGYISETHNVIKKGVLTQRIYADKERIRQVLVNLVTNAIKYSPKKNKVIITVKEDNQQLTVSVKDYGLGIPKEQQPHIFDRFYRVAGKEQKKIDGLGLGLYITHEIIKEHQGEMWVESKVGKGSTFSFSLPLK